MNKYFLNCNGFNELNNLSAAWRLLESEYTRLPGFTREISFWANQCNEMDSIESFITEKRKKDEEPNDIINELVSNFNLTVDQAKEKFAKW